MKWAFAAVIMAMATPTASFAQSHPEYIRLGNTVKNLFDYIRDWTNKRF